MIYVPGFFKEIEKLQEHGINTQDRILMSDRFHIDLDLHTKVDGLEEVELGKGSIGTTKKGIGPTYSTKATRSGIHVSEIFTKELFDSKLRNLYRGYKKRYGDLLQYDPEEEIARFDTYRESLKPFVVDQVPLIESAIKGNVKMLVEGSQALMLDIDAGTYPFVTSSNTGLAAFSQASISTHARLRRPLALSKPTPRVSVLDHSHPNSSTSMARSFNRSAANTASQPAANAAAAGLI